MPRPRSKKAKRQALIATLENMIANECYNANIQNYGPYGTYEGEGRQFRYPTSYFDAQGKKNKKWSSGAELAPPEFRSGHYAFGANQLYIVHGLERVIEYLEENHKLEI